MRVPTSLYLHLKAGHPSASPTSLWQGVQHPDCGMWRGSVKQSIFRDRSPMMDLRPDSTAHTSTTVLEDLKILYMWAESAGKSQFGAYQRRTVHSIYATCLKKCMTSFKPASMLRRNRGRDALEPELGLLARVLRTAALLWLNTLASAPCLAVLLVSTSYLTN